MHVIINRIHFGNFRFILELEAGPDIEVGQLTLWVAEKIDVCTLPLGKFTIEQLIYAVREPLRTRLYRRLNMERQTLQHSFAEKLAVTGDARPKHLQKKAHQLQRQQENALMQVERNIRQGELLTLDRAAYDLEILQAESHFFTAERFLRRFQENEMSEDEVRQFCFEFAFDRVRREQILADAALQQQPARPIFEEEQAWEEG